MPPSTAGGTPAAAFITLPMKRAPLWHLSVTTTGEAEEAVAELCRSLFGAFPVAHTDVETGVVTVSVFLPNRPPAVIAQERLLDGLDTIRRGGLHTGRGDISFKAIKPEDWADSWKAHFPPIEIGRSLLIKPSWSKRRPAKGQAVVVLDPGLSFGTGQHPTTAFCLQELIARRKNNRSQTFLDIGTGSGILAIAAARLGYTSIEAFDSDRAAVRIASANARRNRVSGKMHIAWGDLTKPSKRNARRYDVVCANLVSNVLLSAQCQILRRLKSGGILVLAGILKGEFPRLARAYTRAGLKLVHSRAENEWRSGTFQHV